MTTANLKQAIKDLPEEVFRSYDIRGLGGEELNYNTAYAIGKGYATFLIQRRIYDCVVGHDCRLTSEEISSGVIDALTNSGIDVYNIGLTLTPISYFAQYYFRTKGLIMITASHNPSEFNGMKVGNGYSDTMMGSELQTLKDIIKSGNFIEREVQGNCETYEIKQDYFADLRKRVDKIGKFKVVVDTCNGTAGPFLPEILRGVGCEVIEQCTEPNGNFPNGHPDPTNTETLDRIKSRVLQEEADLGLGFDCDGDRIGLVDGKGRTISNDRLLAIYALDILDLVPGAKIIYNTLCSKLVQEVVSTNGGESLMWMTGHSNIKAKIKEERAIFGGEHSGHFFFMDTFYGHDDSAIAALKLLAYLTRKNVNLSELIDNLPSYISSPSIYVGVNAEKKTDTIEHYIKPNLKKLFPKASVSEIDGIRIDTNEEMVAIRQSNTSALISLIFESKSDDKFVEIKQKIIGLIKDCPDIDINTGSNHEFLQ